MKFITDLSKGVLGQSDSAELWEEILAYIPDEVLLKPNVKILSVACGHCTEAVIIAKRMIALGISKEAVRESIWLIDKYQMFTNPAKVIYGFNNVVTADFLEWKTDMKFDVVIGNPPYQNGKNKSFYLSFIKKSIEMADKVLMITPIAWMKDTNSTWKKMKSHIEFINPDVSSFFPNVSGTTIQYFIYDKTQKFEDITVIKNGTKTSLADCAPSNITKDEVALSIINKIYKIGTVTVYRGKGQHNLVNKKNNTHIYEVFLSSKEDRRLMYSNVEPNHYGLKKVIVSHIMEPYRFDRFGEVSTKGVGRYAHYYLGTDSELANIVSYFNSKIYAFVDKHTRHGRYTKPEIPIFINAENIFSQYNLTQEEINYIESNVK